MFITGITPVLMRTFPCVCTGEQNSTGFEKEHFVQITEALIQSRETSGVLFSRRWTTGRISGILLHTPFGRRKYQRATDSAFCTSFYRQVHERITERNHTPVHPRRWYYAGCGNNMEEQHTMPVAVQPGAFLPSASQCDVDEECSQVVDLLQQSWQVIRLADNAGWKSVFRSPGVIHLAVCCVKNSRIVSGVTGCDRHIYRPVQRCTLITAQ